MDQDVPPRPPRVLLSSEGRGWRGLNAAFFRVTAGRMELESSPAHRLGILFGSPVTADCRCDGVRLRSVRVHGDIDIIPAGLHGVWTDEAACGILGLDIAPDLLRQAAAELGLNPETAALAPAFQLRDPRIEAIAWAIKAELEAEVPSDRLYAETLATALALRLVERGRQPRPAGSGGAQRLSVRQRRQLEAFIESRLDQTLSLADLAAVAGLGISHFKTLFRNSFGMPVHRYVVLRRVERARRLLLSGGVPASRIALEAGFADQSHMTHCMRRVLGTTPGAIARLRADVP